MLDQALSMVCPPAQAPPLPVAVKCAAAVAVLFLVAAVCRSFHFQIKLLELKEERDHALMALNKKDAWSLSEIHRLEDELLAERVEVERLQEIKAALTPDSGENPRAEAAHKAWVGRRMAASLGRACEAHSEREPLRQRTELTKEDWAEERALISEARSEHISGADWHNHCGKMEGVVTLSYSGISTFARGLEGIVGAPGSKVEETMEREHTKYEDATIEFYASNYGVSSTSMIEWAFVRYPERGFSDALRAAHPGRTWWPAEKKLILRRHSSAGIGLVAEAKGRAGQAGLERGTQLQRSRSSIKAVTPEASPRTMMARSDLEKLIEDKNKELAKLKLVGLVIEEALAARLYTGPLYAAASKDELFIFALLTYTLLTYTLLTNAPSTLFVKQICQVQCRAPWADQ